MYITLMHILTHTLQYYVNIYICKYLHIKTKAAAEREGGGGVEEGETSSLGAVTRM
jgi:hypothetical protein